jgi:hypothetical protein
MDNTIDERINWRSFYLNQGLVLQGNGENVSARCPFHDDRSASLSINTKTGQYQCFACGETGNGYTFLQKYREVSEEDARQIIRELAGFSPEPAAHAKLPRFTLDQYAASKKLSAAELESWGVKNSRSCVVIPYMDEAGVITCTRRRLALEGPTKFRWEDRNGKPRLIPYGLWRLKEIRERGWVVLVEGESDTHTLWHHGVPTIGIPGARTFQEEWARYFTGLKIYVHQEPDQGGKEFVETVSAGLVRGRWTGESLIITTPGAKDPSALHMADPDAFPDKWKAAMEAATPLDIRAQLIRPEDLLPKDAPFQPLMPGGWRINEKGVFILKDEGEIRICPVPVTLTARLHSLDTGEEKVEIAFMRDNEWHIIRVPRSVAFQTRNLPMLADKGLPVTSENAKLLVKFFGELEAENLTQLPVLRSVERMGWISQTQFLPGLAEAEVQLDAEGGLKSLADAYHAAGSLEDWVKGISVIREHPIARFIMAAAFAAPLLKPLRERSFFIHTWGPSKGGKTATLKAALSVWGEPEGLMASFNTTKVALERMAGFYADLPVGIDERQVVGDKQQFIESVVYMLGMGKGRARGAKQGGLQAIKSWRTIFLTTGEESLTQATSLQGIATRALEIWGTPISDEKAARKLHKVVVDNYGWAGPEFVRRVVEAQKEEPKALQDEYAEMFAWVEQRSKDNVTSHLAAVAACALADFYASRWFWGVGEDQALSDAQQLALTVLKKLESANEVDTAERAREFIFGWAAAYGEKFTEGGHAPLYGLRTAEGLMVVPSFLEEALNNAGFNPKRIMRDFADRGWLVTEDRAEKRRLTVRRRWFANRVLMYVLVVPEDGK